MRYALFMFDQEKHEPTEFVRFVEVEGDDALTLKGNTPDGDMGMYIAFSFEHGHLLQRV